ncbi:SIR2 family protein [Aeromonas sp. 602826]|uniref:SIR2 family protein n=1 Tax=Aeromonas TaxID=642 RepID=UPI003BA34FF5
MIESKPQGHLINILKSTKNHHPNFTLFLGAGASITSGIKSAGDMINEWRETYSQMYTRDILKSRPWYEKNNEYSELFEALYDQPTQRREYIENCIVDAKPSWGYIYLANLLQKTHFNTIFTTNFDDLVNESCYAFSSKLRPVVCAHDSSIKNIRLTSSRPKIIKLHGDFLFDNIKNTARELESLEDNMRSKFRQYASEFGMIVIGYAGNDRSIMDTLNTLLHSGNAFPHGIYWCIRDEQGISEEVKNLARFPRFHLIKINGFDEFMAELHQALDCTLQEEVANPYVALAQKLDESPLINDEEEEEDIHDIIKKDINTLKSNVKKIHSAHEVVNKLERLLQESDTEGNIETGLSNTLKDILEDIQLIDYNSSYKPYLFPKAMLAEIAYQEQDYKKSLELSKMSLAKDSKNTSSILIYLRSAINLKSNDEILDAISKLKLVKNFNTNEVKRAISTVVDAMSGDELNLAGDILKILIESAIGEEHKKFIYLNDALLSRLKGEKTSSIQNERLTNIVEAATSEDNWWLALGCAILLDNDNAILEAVEHLNDEDLMQVVAASMPIFQFIPEDVEQKIVEIAISRKVIENVPDSNDNIDEEMEIQAELSTLVAVNDDLADQSISLKNEELKDENSNVTIDKKSDLSDIPDDVVNAE